ncbi:UNVERIFIED_CONTAM: hypothetical protein Sradi_3267000 [Sesamum radiatum]|uniref:Uncharacterized protein n=1 Tax=Sesamum radiatum TaxID=300843 RepID=A0AAW2R079_SESRA
MCVNFRDLNKACPSDYYPLPRIDQLVNSTSGCELLSMMDASQGYHQIMLVPEDHKKWDMDIVGPFPLVPGQKKFLLVAIDYFTKWVEQSPLPVLRKGKS